MELSEGVNRFSQNIRLSEEDYAEYLSISNKLAEISPSLISGYTDQGDALLYIGATAEETGEKLNRILEAEKTLAQQNMIANMDDVANGIYYQVKSAEGRIAALQYELDHSSKNSASLEYLHNLIKDVNENTKMISLGVETGLAFEEIQKLKEAIKNSGARIVDHPTFDNMEFYAGDYALVQAAIEKFYAQISYTRRNEAAAYINGLKKDILEQENTIRGAYSQITSNLSAWAKNTYEYDFLSEPQQNLINALIPNLNWKAIKAETGAAFSSAAEYAQYIRENILTPLMSIPEVHNSIKVIIYSLTGLLFAIACTNLKKTKLFSGLLYKINNKSINDDIFDAVINYDKKTMMCVYLKSSDVYYVGRFCFKEEKGINSWISLVEYCCMDKKQMNKNLIQKIMK